MKNLFKNISISSIIIFFVLFILDKFFNIKIMNLHFIEIPLSDIRLVCIFIYIVANLKYSKMIINEKEMEILKLKADSRNRN